jgi:hypothetical protein
MLEVLDLQKCLYVVYYDGKVNRTATEQEELQVCVVPRKKHWFAEIIFPAAKQFIIDLDRVTKYFSF